MHWCVRVRTRAVPIAPPHCHLLVLFGRGEEGNRLAEAEAALGTHVLLHRGARKTNLQLIMVALENLVPEP